MDELLKACDTAITQCLGVQKNETLLIIGDEPLRKIAFSFFKAGKKRAKEVKKVKNFPFLVESNFFKRFVISITYILVKNLVENSYHFPRYMFLLFPIFSICS